MSNELSREYRIEGNLWQVEVVAAEGFISVVGWLFGQKEWRRDTILLDQQLGEPALLGLWKDRRVPSCVKYAVEVFHSQHRRDANLIEAACERASYPVAVAA